MNSVRQIRFVPRWPHAPIPRRMRQETMSFAVALYTRLLAPPCPRDASLDTFKPIAIQEWWGWLAILGVVKHQRRSLGNAFDLQTWQL